MHDNESQIQGSSLDTRLHALPFFTDHRTASHSPAINLAAKEPLEQGREELDGDAKHDHTPVVRAMEYGDVSAGIRAVDAMPYDPFPDTIRESDVPARKAQTRFQYTTAPWAEEVKGFMEEDRPLIPVGADMVTGTQWPTEEHRPLTDGSHG